MNVHANEPQIREVDNAQEKIRKHDETSIVTGYPSEKSRWYRAYLSTLGNRGALLF